MTLITILKKNMSWTEARRGLAPAQKDKHKKDETEALIDGMLWAPEGFVVNNDIYIK